MTYDELANKMIEVSVDTSDPLTSNFQNLFKNLPDEKLIQRELLYLKAFFSSFAVASMFTYAQKEQAKQVNNLMLKKFEINFAHNDYGCGANYFEFVNAYEFYWNKLLSYNANRFSPKDKPLFMFDQMTILTTMGFCHDFFKFLGEDYYKSSFLVDSNKFQGTAMRTYKKIEDQLKERTNQSNQCYVATATYNNPFHPDVIYLRNFRDNYLNKSFCGRLFIHMYYLTGPYLAFFPKHFSLVKRISHRILEKIVIKLKQDYY